MTPNPGQGPDISQLLDKQLSNTGEIKTHIRIGDRDVPISDTAGLEAAYNESLERNRREIEGLKQINESLQKRYAEPEQVAPPPQQYQQPPQQFQPQSREYRVEDWVNEVQKDPVSATEKALAKALGLAPNISVSNVFQALAAANMGLTQKVQQLEGNFQKSQEEMESQHFMENHSDYPGGKEAMRVLSNKMESYRMAWTADNLHFAYLDAISKGEITPSREEAAPQQWQPQQAYNQPYNPYNQQFAQPQQNVGLPSLRQNPGQAPPDNDVRAMIQRLDKVEDSNEVARIVRDLYRQSGQF